MALAVLHPSAPPSPRPQPSDTRLPGRGCDRRREAAECGVRGLRGGRAGSPLAGRPLLPRPQCTRARHRPGRCHEACGLLPHRLPLPGQPPHLGSSLSTGRFGWFRSRLQPRSGPGSCWTASLLSRPRTRRKEPQELTRGCSRRRVFRGCSPTLILTPARCVRGARHTGTFVLFFETRGLS